MAMTAVLEEGKHGLLLLEASERLNRLKLAYLGGLCSLMEASNS
jgi:hypothetical protein